MTPIRYKVMDYNANTVVQGDAIKCANKLGCSVQDLDRAAETGSLIYDNYYVERKDKKYTKVETGAVTGAVSSLKEENPVYYQDIRELMKYIISNIPIKCRVQCHYIESPINRGGAFVDGTIIEAFPHYVRIQVGKVTTCKSYSDIIRRDGIELDYEPRTTF